MNVLNKCLKKCFSIILLSFIVSIHFGCEVEREISPIVLEYFKPLEGKTIKLIGSNSGDTLVLQTSFFINKIINERFNNVNYQENTILRKFNGKVTRLITIASDENDEFNLKGLSEVDYSIGSYEDPHSYTKKMTISEFQLSFNNEYILNNITYKNVLQLDSNNLIATSLIVLTYSYQFGILQIYDFQRDEDFLRCIDC
jgi:hypothetical protein